MHRALAVLLAVASVSAVAETTPTPGRFDGRIKVIAYNADDVVKVVGHYGYSTDIVFSPYEDVAAGAIAVGDQDAWDIAPAGHHLFVKPHAKGAITNMTVVTNRRVYQFSLDAREITGPTHADSRGMFFQVRFTYPDDDAAAKRALAEATRREKEEARLQTLLDAAPVPRNFDYYACGSRELWPSEAFDDGRFTYLTFPAAQEIPAIFVVGTDRTESLANGGMHGDQYVVQATARKLVLRKGDAVACIENRSFEPWGVGTPGGTSNPHLIRRTRANAPHKEVLPLPSDVNASGPARPETPKPGDAAPSLPEHKR